MPIASDRGGVNAAQIGQVGEGNANTNITPSVGDFMSAVQQGFITADDIRKRIVDSTAAPGQIVANQQNFQDQKTIRPLAREAAAGQLQSQIQLQPKTTEVAGKTLGNQSTQADIQATQFEALKQVQPFINQKALIDARQQLADAQQHGNIATLEALHKQYGTFAGAFTLPLTETTDPATGQVTRTLDQEKASEDIQKGFSAALKMQQQLFQLQHTELKEVKSKNAAGVEKTNIVPINKFTGQPTVPGMTTEGTIEPNVNTEASELRKEIQNNHVLKGISEADRYRRIVNNLLQKPNPSNADDTELVESLVKLSDPNGVIREFKVEFTREMTPRYQAFVKDLQRLYANKNTVLNAGDRAQIQSVFNTMQQSFDEAAHEELQPYQEQAAQLNIPLARVLTPEKQKLLKTGPQPAAPVAAVGQTSPGAPAAAPAKPGLPPTTTYKGFNYQLGPDGNYHLVK